MVEVGAEVTIRPGEPADIEAVAALWCEAFPGRRSAAERARLLEAGGRYGGLETVLVARDGDDRLLGACKIYRMTQYIAGVPAPMMGLAAVAVAPAARRQGLGARICARAMDAARERGDVLSVLYPFRADYYERLGWGLVGELHEYRFRTAALPPFDEARHVRIASGVADAEAITACYARVAAQSNGPIERDARVWADRLASLGAPGQRVVVHDADGVAGYAMLRRRSDAATRDAVIQVRELVTETDAAYRGILGYLASHADRWPLARHTARVEERFGDFLPDPRPPGAGRARWLYFPTARIIRGPMMRILDVPAALGLRRYFDADRDPAAHGATIEVRVDDPQIPANRGPWLVRIADGRASVSPRDGDDVDAHIHTDAPTLARMFAGDLPPRLAVRSGRAVTAGDPDLLDRAFTTRERCWLLDEF